MRYLAWLILLISSSFLSSPTWAYELVVIQTVSKTGHTFITRTGKKDGVFPGKKVTFTSDNVSVIAKALEVTREFTQWRIENKLTEIPFAKEQVVTMYDATEYLWALSPEEVKSKYIKSEIFAPRLSLAAHLSLFRGLSASVSEAADTSDQRGGLVFEGMMEREFTKNVAFAGGFRYSREITNVAEASFTTSQVLAILEARYYFDKIPQFYNTRVGLALGAGYGQSQTTTSGQTSSGNAAILPITKVSLNFPVNDLTEFVIEGAFESARIEEEFADGAGQSSNTDNLKYGMAFRRYLDW